MVFFVDSLLPLIQNLLLFITFARNFTIYPSPISSLLCLYKASLITLISKLISVLLNSLLTFFLIICKQIRTITHSLLKTRRKAFISSTTIYQNCFKYHYLIFNSIIKPLLKIGRISKSNPHHFFHILYLTNCIYNFQLQ